MAKGKAGMPTIENRRARHDYEILDTLECGIVLLGSEVKSVRGGKVSLAEGYVVVEGVPPRLTLLGVNVAEYPPAPGAHEPTRSRRLLAHRREIEKLARQVDQKGMTIVPLKMYFKEGYAKVLVGLGRGRGKSDKRQRIAEREMQRDMDRAMTRRR
ncbi:MAG: SsrA-binding protein SmpB [Phycisphaeraceae bacterium]|nr:SsrA-binding protein SmpB [Phycisphaeraceae bacterium]